MTTYAYIGIDPGITPTICKNVGNNVEFKTLPVPTMTQLAVTYEESKDWWVEARRYRTLKFLLKRYLKSIPYNLIIGVETLAYSKTFRAGMMGKVELAILDTLYELDRATAMLVFQITPQQWKKHVVGKGNAGKEAVSEFLHDNYPHMPRTPNLNHTDAFAIALTVKHMYEEAMNDKTD